MVYNRQHMILSQIFVYDMYIIKVIMIYVLMNRHCVGSYVNQFNRNNFDVHTSTQIRKLFHLDIILLENSCEK